MFGRLTAALLCGVVMACGPVGEVGGPAPVRGKADDDGRRWQLGVEALDDSGFTTAFPYAYVALSKTAFYENDDQEDIFVVRRTRGSSTETLGRVEIYLTGGDWMAHAVYYMITSLEGGSGSYRVGRVFHLPEFSTPDLEEGALPPPTPYSRQAAIDFIVNELLDAQGRIRAQWTPDPDIEEALDRLVMQVL